MASRDARMSQRCGLTPIGSNPIDARHRITRGTVMTVAKASILTMLLIAATGPAAAQDFYRGKTVTIVVGYSAGGGYDQYARLVARNLGRLIPGTPNVI